MSGNRTASMVDMSWARPGAGQLASRRLARRCRLLAIAVALASFTSPSLAADVIDTLRGQPQLSIFVRLIDSSGVSRQMHALPDVTLFAPRDRAFDELPAGALSALEQPENLDRLRRFVLVHFAARRITDKDIANAEFDVASFEGTTLRIDADDGQTLIENATMLGQEILADNGLVHVIDRVLVPR